MEGPLTSDPAVTEPATGTERAKQENQGKSGISTRWLRKICPARPLPVRRNCALSS